MCMRVHVCVYSHDIDFCLPFFLLLHRFLMWMTIEKKLESCIFLPLPCLTTPAFPRTKPTGSWERIKVPCSGSWWSPYQGRKRHVCKGGQSPSPCTSPAGAGLESWTSPSVGGLLRRGPQYNRFGLPLPMSTSTANPPRWEPKAHVCKESSKRNQNFNLLECLLFWNVK